ncbi:hypothetical protein D6833_12290, partial [Candidatus Parcubacteria bacterium]
GCTQRAAVNPHRRRDAAVRLYNQAVHQYRNGDTRALQGVYERNGAVLGVSELEYKLLLQEHITKAARGKGSAPILERFDRTLLPDFDAYAAELADAYQHSEKSLRTIAEEQSRRYGMRISASHASTIARQYLKKEGRPVASRREAKKRVS